MPNRAYLRGANRERTLVRRLRAEGYYACRSAGSHSEWDVWAVSKIDGHTNVYQLKSKKGGRVEKVKLLKVLGTTRFFWVTYE